MKTGLAAIRSSTGAAGCLMGFVLGLLALGPALAPGYLLSYDMVFVPHQPLTAMVLGTDGSVPRAVPNDLVVVLASHLLPGDVVQKILLLAVFVLGGWGVGRLLDRPLPAVVATCAFVWNAYVLERLVIGHWAFLLGYAALPWVLGFARDVRQALPGALPRLALTLAVTGLAGSTALVLAGALALGLLAWPPGIRRHGRALVVTALVVVGAALPWLVPALTRPGGLPTDPAGAAAFASRADTPLGVVGSVATLGGIWNSAVWPGERTGPVVATVTLLLVLVCLATGLRPLRRAWGATADALIVAAAAALLLSVAATQPLLDVAMRHAITDVPGGGLLRDGQKLVAPAALLVALCAGLAAEQAARYARQGAWLLALAPLVLLPSLAWGAHGRLAPAHYPPEWLALRETVSARLQPGESVAVFPFTDYRRFPWNHDRVALDPMPRALDARVLVNDDLPLASGTIRGEDPAAARLRSALARGEPLGPALAAEHVAFVVDERDQPDPHGDRAGLADLPVRWQQGSLVLHSVPGAKPDRRDNPPAVGMLVALVTMVAAFGAVGLSDRRHAASIRRLQRLTDAEEGGHGERK
jgi:hypothetical protein